ncbi:MAG: hypothetical protein KBA55_01210 [Ruminococcus sp.]|nr:hypothetical protein [Ruminococcus sp.]
MHMSCNSITSIMVSAFVSSAAFLFPQMTAFAADTSDSKGKPSAAVIVIFTLIFAAALISSTIITYKIRTKNIRSHDPDTAEKDDNIS